MSLKQTWGNEAGYLPVSYLGDITLEIGGAKDLAGNFNPLGKVIAQVNPGEEWQALG